MINITCRYLHIDSVVYGRIINIFVEFQIQMKICCIIGQIKIDLCLSRLCLLESCLVDLIFFQCRLWCIIPEFIGISLSLKVHRHAGFSANHTRCQRPGSISAHRIIIFYAERQRIHFIFWLRHSRHLIRFCFWYSLTVDHDRRSFVIQIEIFTCTASQIICHRKCISGIIFDLAQSCNFRDRHFIIRFLFVVQFILLLENRIPIHDKILEYDNRFSGWRLIKNIFCLKFHRTAVFLFDI